MTLGHPGLELLPCGHSIGMNVLQRNFKIVDLSPVMKPNGIYYYPAREEDLRVNDIILEVDGGRIKSQQDLSNRINEASRQNRKVSLQIQRRNQILLKSVRPYYSPQSDQYKLGIVLKGWDIGLGSLTFFDPLTHSYGAFGHYLTNLPEEGQTENLIVPSYIQSIQKAANGIPGKKIGYLIHSPNFSGTLEKNCPAGVFGTFKGTLENPFFKVPVPVLPKQNIQEGKATLYTVIQGNQIEAFPIRIVSITHKDPTNKDLRIVVEDKYFITRTGGILQGMSGSPILQNDQLIGAISYLIRSNPLCGYAVSLENMLRISRLSLLQSG